MAPHTGSVTPEQIDTLLNFLDEHRDLARGRLRGCAQAKRLWKELCNMLNSMGGCTKTIQQWQEEWLDRQYLTLEAVADSKSLASTTGGGPSMAPSLSQWQLKILSIMGDGFGEPQTGARVPAFPETNEPIPSTSSQTSQPQSFSQPLSEEVVKYFEPRHEVGGFLETTSRTPVLQESLTSTVSSKPTRRRRRQSVALARSDVRSRLFQYEEMRAEREIARNTELAGIRAALLELCGLLREYLNNMN